MTLTTHAVVGAAIASTMPEHPVIGFVLAFASHFLLDSIAHWDYPLASYKADEDNHLNDTMVINKHFFFDLLKIGLDLLCGVTLVLIFFALYGTQYGAQLGAQLGTHGGALNFLIPFIGVVGAILPDALQFVYWKWRHQPLTTHQEFHIWIHSREDFNDRPLIGVPFQILIIAAVIFASRI